MGVDCVFCSIVTGASRAQIVLQDEVSMAFLDRRPLFAGHFLLVPKIHVVTLPELPDELLHPLFANAKLLALAMEEGLGAEGSFVAMNNRVSQSVAHLHIHVVPRKRKDGLKGFFWPRHPYRDQAHMEETRQRLVETLSRLHRPAAGPSCGPPDLSHEF